MIKVGINGFGTIGKRVAEAVTLQDYMTVVGVVKTKPTYEVQGALSSDYAVFVSTSEKIPFFEKQGIAISGVTEDLVSMSDVIIDCTPGKLGVNNMEMYKNGNTKAIWQACNLLVPSRPGIPGPITLLQPNSLMWSSILMFCSKS